MSDAPQSDAPFFQGVKELTLNTEAKTLHRFEYSSHGRQVHLALRTIQAGGANFSLVQLGAHLLNVRAQSVDGTSQVDDKSEHNLTRRSQHGHHLVPASLKYVVTVGDQIRFR